MCFRVVAAVRVCASSRCRCSTAGVEDPKEMQRAVRQNHRLSHSILGTDNDMCSLGKVITKASAKGSINRASLNQARCCETTFSSFQRYIQPNLTTFPHISNCSILCCQFQSILPQRLSVVSGRQGCREGYQNKMEGVPDGIHQWLSVDQFPPHLQKYVFETYKLGDSRLTVIRYWFQRYKIWDKYDEGVWMTEDAWFGVTPEPIAKYVATLTQP